MVVPLKLTGITMLAAGLLALVPLAAASTTMTGQLSTAALVANGDVQFTGQFKALLHDDNLTTPLGSPDLAITAQHLHVETDSTPLTVHGPFGAFTQSTYPTTAAQDFAPSSISNFTVRASHLLDVFVAPGSPEPVAMATSSCAGVQPSGQIQVQHNPFVRQSRDTMTAATASSLKWVGCAGIQLQLHITGSFVLAMWEADATLHSAGGTTTLHSGSQNPSAAPHGSPDVSSIATSDQEIYVTATNAVLTMTLNGAQVYVDQPHLQVGQGHLELDQAAGNLALGAVSMPIQAQSLALAGNAAADLKGRAVATPFDVRLIGNLDGAESDGHPLLVSTTRVGASWLVLGAVGLVATSAVTFPLLRRRSPSPARTWRLEETLEDLIGRRHFPEALPLGLKLLDWQPRNPVAHYRMGRVLRDLGQPAKAVRHHDEAHRLLVNDGRKAVLRGENSLEMACALAQLHAQADSAQRPDLLLRVLHSMTAAVAAKPSLETELELHPELRPFLALNGAAPLF